MSDETNTTASDNSVQIPSPLAWLVAKIGWPGTFFLFMMLSGSGGWGINDILALASGRLPPALEDKAVDKSTDLEAIIAANQALVRDLDARIATEHQALLQSIDIIREQCKSGSDEPN